MRCFFALIGAENKKLWKRISSKIMILILIGLVFGLCGLYKLNEDTLEKYQDTSPQSAQFKGDWKAELKAQNQSDEAQIKTAEKSKLQNQKQSIDKMKMNVAENKYRIANNLKPSKKIQFWDIVLASGMAEFVALLAMIACTGLVAGEFSDGTMKTMIARPFSRWQILTAKFVAVFIYTLILQLVSCAFVAAASFVFFGTGGINSPQLLWIGGGVLGLPGFSAAAITCGLDFLQVLVYTIFAFAISVVSRSRALATGLAIFLMFGGDFTRLLANNFDWGKLIFFADTGFSGFVTNGAPFYGITLGFALLVCAVYSVVFMAAAYVFFAKRDIN